VVSINSYNNGPHELATILPITSKYRSYLWYIELKPEDSGLQKISYVITDQVRTLSLERFHGSAVGNIDYRTLAAIEFRLRSLLGLLDYSI
jgi:mRNA-degrading endonuclease toxin of MazEF toxin-antitoxin module